MIQILVRWHTIVVNRFVQYKLKYSYITNIVIMLLKRSNITENVFTRPNDKCYFNGNVYEPKAELSKTDSALNPCLASCYCNQPTPDNEYEKSIKYVLCSLLFISLYTLDNSWALTI